MLENFNVILNELQSFFINFMFYGQSLKMKGKQICNKGKEMAM